MRIRILFFLEWVDRRGVRENEYSKTLTSAAFGVLLTSLVECFPTLLGRSSFFITLERTERQGSFVYLLVVITVGFELSQVDGVHLLLYCRGVVEYSPT